MNNVCKSTKKPFNKVISNILRQYVNENLPKQSLDINTTPTATSSNSNQVNTPQIQTKLSKSGQITFYICPLCKSSYLTRSMCESCMHDIGRNNKELSINCKITPEELEDL